MSERDVRQETLLCLRCGLGQVHWCVPLTSTSVPSSSLREGLITEMDDAALIAEGGNPNNPAARRFIALVLREAAQAIQHLAAPVALPEEPPVVSCGHGGGDLCPACVGVLVRDYHALRARLAKALQVSGLIEQLCQHVRSHGVSWNPDGASDHEGHPIHLWDPDGEPMSDHPWIHGQVLMRKACAVTVAAYADRISALLKTGPETSASPTKGTT